MRDGHVTQFLGGGGGLDAHPEVLIAQERDVDAGAGRDQRGGLAQRIDVLVLAGHLQGRVGDDGGPAGGGGGGVRGAHADPSDVRGPWPVRSGCSGRTGPTSAGLALAAA
ncbi:hypothetical protein ACFFX0_19395 [Citricoccus parietis]|uniref:Uncharacterized protein n=1 Tax=Citricoccus parietis TaxID=592307 RepID=A0ABV5G2U4_9MICC